MLDKSAKRTAYKWLIDKAKLARFWLFLTIGISISSGLLLILQANILSETVDKVYIQHISRSMLMLPLFSLLIIMVMRSILAWLREVSSFNVSAKVRAQIRTDLANHIANLNPLTIAKVQTGGYSTAAIEQIEALHSFYADYLPQLALVLFIPLAILIFIFPLNWVAALILLISAPLIPLFMILIGLGIESINQGQLQTLSRLSGHFLDTLQGLTTLKLFNRAKVQAKNIETVADQYRQQTMKILKVAFLSSGVLELISALAIALLAVILGLSLLGQFHFGHFETPLTLHKALFILLLAPEFFLPLRQLAVFYHARAEAVAAAHELSHYFNLIPEKHLGEQKLESSNIEIVFKNVSFAYSKEQILLHAVNLHIATGTHIAIIGASGMGKTTLINLIAGFIQPNAGNIFINKKQLGDLDIIHWRNNFSLLRQNTRLFHGSIKENICLAKPNASNEEIATAAKKAHVLEFSQQLSAGLDSVIGEQNFGLSGGQVQRIALARVFLANKPILLLDEPTANLDANTEQIILTALQEFIVGKTVITVSHHPLTIIKAAKIYCLHHGKLQEIEVNG